LKDKRDFLFLGQRAISDVLPQKTASWGTTKSSRVSLGGGEGGSEIHRGGEASGCR